LYRRRRSGSQDRILLERDNSQLRWRLAEEGSDEEELIEVTVLVGVQRPAGGREPCFDLEMCASARRERALRSDAPAGDEERARMTVLRRGCDDAPLDSTEPLQPVELPADALERLQAVAEPRRVLVPSRVRELEEPVPQPRQRGVRLLELVGRQSSGSQLCAAT
jgi:hypothetical protein